MFMVYVFASQNVDWVSGISITVSSQEKYSLGPHSGPTGSQTTFPKDSQVIWMNIEVREALV